MKAVAKDNIIIDIEQGLGDNVYGGDNGLGDVVYGSEPSD